jgi:hypothetical protein
MTLLQKVSGSTGSKPLQHNATVASALACLVCIPQHPFFRLTFAVSKKGAAAFNMLDAAAGRGDPFKLVTVDPVASWLPVSA